MSWDGVLPLLVFVAAWGALYLPVYLDFAGEEWRREENAHQPFVMAIAAIVATATVRRPDFRYYAGHGAFLAGGALVLFGLALYASGKLGEATLLVSASQGAIAFGLALALFGVSGAARLWFPLFLTIYLVIWPDWALDAVTAPLKRLVSALASEALYLAGLPVAHAGATIAAGPYRLLVADACAGLNSLIALSASGAVYLWLAKRRSFAANAAVILSLAPIGVAANLIRVIILVLITYYFGHDAGQSFLHETAGLVSFAAALGLTFGVDAVAAALWEKRR